MQGIGLPINPSNNMAEGPDTILASAATSASYNMVLQLFLRLTTFLPNIVILRFISKEVLGIVNVRLLLLYTTILFVAREAFRRACLSTEGDKPWRQLINWLWCIIPIGAVVAMIFGSVWAYFLEQPDPATVPHYRLAVLCFALSSFIELLAEPLWIVGQMLLFVRIRVLIEGLANTVRCLSSITLILMFPWLGLRAFSIASIAQSLTYTFLYYAYFVRYIRKNTDDKFPFKRVADLLPREVPGKPLVNLPMASLTWSFFKQSFFKQILTEGERYVMTIFDVLSFADQGVYDVIHNLGSMVTRFLFLPLEDSAYLFFTQKLHRGVLAKAQPKQSIELATTVLHCLLKLVLLIGLTMVTFGYPYSFLALDIYGGSMLSTGAGPSLLKCYCLYVLLLAGNGITECFSFSTMGKHEIDRYNHKMLIFSVLFLGSSWYLTKPFGSHGFIMANCLNMTARITHSIYFINKFYKDSPHKPLRGLVPAVPVLAVLIGSLIITSYSEVTLCCSSGLLYSLAHITIGGVCGVLLIVCIYLSEKQLVNFVKEHIIHRKKEAVNVKTQSCSKKEKKKL